MFLCYCETDKVTYFLLLVEYCSNVLILNLYYGLTLQHHNLNYSLLFRPEIFCLRVTLRRIKYN